MLAEIRNEPDADSVLANHLDHAVSTGRSWRSAPLMALAYLQGIGMSKEGLDADFRMTRQRYDALGEDPRVDRLIDDYLASIAATNPIFGAVMYLLRLGFRLRLRIHFSQAQRADEDRQRAKTSSRLFALDAAAKA